MQGIVDVISNVGFPIAMCLIIMYYWNNQYTQTIQQLKETVSRLTEVIAQNTQAINTLIVKFGDDEDDGR